MREPFPSKSLRSAEGGGRALGRFQEFLLTLRRDDRDEEVDLIAEAIFTPPYQFPPAEAMRPRDFAGVVSELIGFWVVWHLTGGFERLELAGWHRATIYRKVARFRDFFGAHPDEFEFDWLKIDAEAVWERMLLGPPDFEP